MFELRWVTRRTACKVSCNPGAYGAEMIDGFNDREILQYRTGREVYTGVEQIIWTEWKDVPYVGMEP